MLLIIKVLGYYHIRTVWPNNKRCIDVVSIMWVIMGTLALSCPIGENIAGGEDLLGHWKWYYLLWFGLPKRGIEVDMNFCVGRP